MRKKIPKALFAAIITLIINCSFVQDENETTDLSFLQGQKVLKLEFDFSKFTVNDEPGDQYLKNAVAKLEEKEQGRGEKLQKNWDYQISDDGAPMALCAWFHNNLENEHFDCVMDFPLWKYGVDPVEQKKKFKPTKAKYVCVVTLVSIKTGLGKVITPTLWLNYTFYENDKRDVVLAKFKSHFDYGRDKTSVNSKGEITAIYDGSWTDINDAYYKGGKSLAKKVKKYIK